MKYAKILTCSHSIHVPNKQLSIFNQLDEDCIPTHIIHELKKGKEVNNETKTKQKTR